MSNTTPTPTPPGKRVFLFIYDSFAEFEISVLCTVLSGSPHILTTCAVTDEHVLSTGGLRVMPDISVQDLDPDSVDALIVPGGEASGLLGNDDLRALVGELDRRGTLLAAICGGPAVLGDAGVLDRRTFTAALQPGDPAYPGIAGRGERVAELVVTDHHVVTATGSSYLAFAEEVLRCLDERPEPETLTFFREPSLA